jgi:hypothetical protein
MMHASLNPASPPVRSERDLARAQAREWSREKIVSGDLCRMIDRIEAASDRHRVVDYDDDFPFVYADHVLWDDAVGLLREAANHYPHPSGGLLFDAGFHRLPHGMDRFGDAVDEDDLTDIVTAILENPDALLG